MMDWDWEKIIEKYCDLAMVLGVLFLIGLAVYAHGSTIYS